MSRNIEIERAVRFLKLTLPEMSKRDIPVTPANYAVWYEYSIGENEALKSEIDELIATNATFDENLNNGLYERYIAENDRAAVDRIRTNVRTTIQGLLKQLSSEGDSLANYSDSLELFSDKATGVAESDNVGFLVTELLTETLRQKDATRSLQSSLDKMAKEVSTLRDEVETLDIEASTDPLTRVSNRRAFDIAAERAIADSKMDNTPICLLLLDIDHFKKFNDIYGHLVGDKVLRFVASVLKKHVKLNDIVARFGGEEFVVLLPETPYNGALTVAEQLRERISKQKLSDRSENVSLGSITASFGVAQYREGDDMNSLLERADRCLYQAKDQGRNRVCGEND